MGHHIDAQGRFQSDKYPELAPDKIVVSFKHHEAWPALAALAAGYARRDPALAHDILTRLAVLGHGKAPESFPPSLRERARALVGQLHQILLQDDTAAAEWLMVRVLAGARP